MKTTHPTSLRQPQGSQLAKGTAAFKRVFLSTLTVLASVASLHAASILWVSDTVPLGFSGAGGNNITDAGFVRLLESAGHTVARWNSPDAQATRLSAADLATVNTYDLIILGRAGASGQHQFPQSQDWNVGIIKPLICMSPYFVRPDGGRFGWFTGGTLPDDVPTALSAGDSNDPAVQFLFGGVAMNGTNTAFAYDELLDRNTSHILNAPVPGAVVYSTASFLQEDNNTPRTCYAIVGFPAGTIVRTNADVLAGYRMYFSGGTREGATFPNAIPLYTGRENLTATGEAVFLRAVQLAINNGVAPVIDPLAPPAIVAQPAGATALRGRSASFSVTVGGAAPRTVQWQRDVGDGVTFTNIPDATTAFSISRLALPSVADEDNNAKFRVEVVNANGSIISDVVTLTVTPDTAGPVPLAVSSLDGMTISISFDEAVDPNDANFPFNYLITSASGSIAAASNIRPDGRTIDVMVDVPLSPTFSVNISELRDLYGNAIPSPGVDLAGVSFGLLSANIGALNPVGTNLALNSTTFEVSGGGLDFQATTEQLHYVYKLVAGDFEARVRVLSIKGTNRLESVAKAILGARATTDANSASVNAFVTPPAPGDGNFGSVARTTAGAAASSNFLAAPYALGSAPATFPAWLRIRRVGDVFTTYGGADGNTWTQIGSITVAMGTPVLVGAGVNSHRNGQVATATFSDFQVLPIVNSPTLVNSAYAAGSFSASFQTQNGISYRVQYKDDLNAANWTDLTTIVGDGILKSFNDTAGGNRFYRVITP